MRAGPGSPAATEKRLRSRQEAAEASTVLRQTFPRMRILLRLDDGGIIGHLNGNEVVKLSATEAQEQGRLTDADKRRITQLLNIAAGHAQISPPLVNGSKRRDSDGLEALGSAKRSKQRAPNGKRATSDNSRGSSLNNQQSWQDKCRAMVKDQLLSLGPEAQWFDRPPDVRYIPDYYDRIKSPMDLGSMLKKLDSGKYKSPQSFCNDMRLVWANCLEYNGKGSKYGKIGDRCSASFEEAWAASGLDSGSRHRRATAGHAATRFDSLEEPEPVRPIRKQPSARTTSITKNARHAEEVASIPMDRDHMQTLAEWMGSIDGEDLEGAINIIKEHGLGGTGEEIELDFDALDNDTLWALDDYMVQIKGGKPDSTGKANSGFQVEPESEYESDDSDVSE